MVRSSAGGGCGEVGGRGGCSRSCEGQHGGEVEALEPGFNGLETGGFEALVVGGEGFGNEDVFEGGAFLADFEVGVAVGAFEVVMEFGHVLVDGGVGKGDFFGEDENATGLHAFGDAGEEWCALIEGDELEGEVEDDDGGVLDGDVLEVGAVELYGGVEVVAGAVDHGGGVVDGDELGAFVLNAFLQSVRGCAEGAAEVVDVGVGLGVAGGEGGEHGEDGAVAGDGAFDHVGKDVGNGVIELEIGDGGLRLLVKIIVLHSNKLMTCLDRDKGKD